jgi:hypothetical protein
VSEKPDETYSTDGPICPYCAHMHSASDDPELYSETMDAMECAGCGDEFRVSVYIRHSWTCEATQ